MKKTRCRTAQKGSGGALQGEGRKHRKPVFTLPPEKVVEQCLKDERDLICAGQVLAVQMLMEAAQWPITVLSEKSDVLKGLWPQHRLFCARGREKISCLFWGGFFLEMPVYL